jgi:hypothetical protein
LHVEYDPSAKHFIYPLTHESLELDDDEEEAGVGVGVDTGVETGDGVWIGAPVVKGVEILTIPVVRGAGWEDVVTTEAGIACPVVNAFIPDVIGDGGGTGANPVVSGAGTALVVRGITLPVVDGVDILIPDVIGEGEGTFAEVDDP